MPDTKGWGGPRRYKPGADGELHRTWNGKLPEEFTPADTFSFMADTDIQLHGKVSADTLPRWRSSTLTSGAWWRAAPSGHGASLPT